MGHEVSHALANHGAQRMSAAQLQGLGAVGWLLQQEEKVKKHNKHGKKVYGVGSQVGYVACRNHETEADK
jgi:Zn-dependent protease with chaperone function